MSRRQGSVAFRAAVRRYLQAHHLADEGQPILVACSGGADSVALLHVLHGLGHPVAAAHVNYGLRGADSEADEQLVRELAARLRVPAAVHRQSPKELAAAEGLSVQVAARRIRYRFFKDELARLGWNRLATGHHGGDQAETVLLHLLRGRSVEVLRGIPVRRGPVIRPLLFAAKAQLIDYLAAEGLPWREDRSNRDPRYLRNRIRHEVLPALAAINPRIEAHLAERAEAYRQQFDALTGDRRLHRLLEGAVAFRDPSFIFIDEIEYTNNFLNFNKLKFHLFFQYILEKEYRMRPTDARRLVGLVDAQAGSRVETAQGWWWRTTDGLRLAAPVPEGAAAEVLLTLVADGSTGSGSTPPSNATVCPPEVALARGVLKLSILDPASATLPPPPMVSYLDPERLAGRLVLRPWRAGERFEPLHFAGTRLVSDELTDAKFPAHLRKQARVLADDLGPVWIETGRIAQRVALTATTRQVLALKRVKPGDQAG